MRWPPWSRAMPSTVSPGWRTLAYTAMFACEPEWGWTLACSAPKSSLARSAAEVLDLVDHLAAAVVALARHALRVLVVEPGAERLEDRERGEVLGRDQLQGLLLAPQLLVQEAGHHRVGGAEARACPRRNRGRCRGGGRRWGRATRRSARSRPGFPPLRRGWSPPMYGRRAIDAIGPSRSRRGGLDDRSMIVEAIPLLGPPSTTPATSSPRASSAAGALLAGDAPWRLAEVEATGPVSSSRARRRSCPGTLTIRVPPPRGTASRRLPTGQTMASGPGQNAPARARVSGSISTSPSSWEIDAASRFNSSSGGRPLMV